jgi:hypothetical protein
MYVCMYVCMYVFIYVCMYVCVCACVYVFLLKYVLYLSDASLLGRLLPSPGNIRLGWKGLPGTNTLAYLAPL